MRRVCAADASRERPDLAAQVAATLDAARRRPKPTRPRLLEEAAASRAPARACVSSWAAPRERGRREPEQLGQRFAMPSATASRSGHRVVVGEQAEVHPAVVRRDRHGEGVAGGERGDREGALEPAAAAVERRLGAGDVRHEEVRGAAREAEARGAGEDRRRREVLAGADDVGAHRALGLRRDRACGRRSRAGAGSGRGRRSGAGTRPGRGRSSATDMGRPRRSATPSVRVPRPCSQRRSAPATTARTTSVTVASNASRTARKSSSRVSSDRHPAVRAGADVERRLGVDGERRPRAAPPRRRARGARARARPAGRSASLTAAAASCAPVGAGPGSQCRGGGSRHVGDGVEQRGRQVDVVRVLDQLETRLRDERPAAALEVLDDPQLPQRLRPVELLREHARRERVELRRVARRRQPGVADVVAEVEGRVVDPSRLAEAERRDRPAGAGSGGRGAAARARARAPRGTAAAGPPAARFPRCARAEPIGSAPWRNRVPCSSPAARPGSGVPPPSTSRRRAGPSTRRRAGIESIADLEGKGCQVLALDVTDEDVDARGGRAGGGRPRRRRRARQQRGLLAERDHRGGPDGGRSAGSSRRTSSGSCG